MIEYERLNYTWGEICKRAGFSDKLIKDITLHYGNHSSSGSSDGLIIEIFRAPGCQWQELFRIPEGMLCWVETEQLLPPGSMPCISERMPVLFPKKIHPDGNNLIDYDEQNRILKINFDLIAACFFMLSRWEETIIDQRDEHGRFPAAASVAYKQRFLNQPVVDEYAVILRKWLCTYLPQALINKSTFHVQISHDIDHLHKPGGSAIKLLGLARNLLFRWDSQAISDSMRHIMAGDGIYPYLWSAQRLMEWAGKLEYRPIFYFMAADMSALDEGYDLSQPRYTALLSAIKRGGYQVGLHAGYKSMNDVKILEVEKERLEKLLQRQLTHVRQHYLRLQSPYTWRLWQQAGFTNDSSMGYADAEGFRCGTCHPFKLYDVENDCELDVIEEPLIVMDGSLFDYRKYDQLVARERILSLAGKCRAVGGVFTLLWHNTSLIHTRYRWGKFYQDLVPELMRL